MTPPESEPDITAQNPDQDLDISRSLLSLFPTIVFNQRLTDTEALNDALEAQVAAVAVEGPGVDTSNVGGYHSGPDFFNRDADCVRELRARLQQVIVQLTKLVLRPSANPRQLHFEIQAWANLLRRGDYHAVHSHPNFFWSGVYYITDNQRVIEHPLSGKLELVDPRAGAALADPHETTLYGRYLLDPVAGQLIIFPSWLAHCVHTYFGEIDRMSIAFNVGFKLR